MVVISAAVVSKTGKVLLARQFVEITKQRIENYLSSFPKLIDVNNQHTVIETENVRFLYQSINQSNQQYMDPAIIQSANQGVWVVLITNKQSNIVEDLETLQSFIKLLTEYCMINSSMNQSIDQQVTKYEYELIFAVDELIGHGGIKEYQSINQIKVFTDMESHEEKLQQIITQSKMAEAKHEAHRKAESIERAREQQKRVNSAMGPASGDRYGGHDRTSSYSSAENDEYRSTVSQPIEKPTPAPQPTTSSNQPAKKVSGMQLGKAKTGDQFFDQLAKEEKLAPVIREAAHQSSSSTTTSASQPANQYGVTVTARERLSVEIDRDGNYKDVSITGELKCCVYDPNDNKIKLHIGMNPDIAQSINQIDKLGYKLQLNPKLDKKSWAEHKIITMADTDKGFPIGSDSAPVLLKWRKPAGTESDVPFSINFWQNEERNSTSVNVEFTYQEDVHISVQDVYIRIPVASMPEVSQIHGEWKYDQRAKILTWHIPLVDAENNTGSLDFTCSSCDYPINVEFSGDQLLSGLVVEKVEDANDPDREMNYNVQCKLEVEKFVIE